MHAIMQPKVVTTSPAIQNKDRQPKATAHASKQEKTGKRFLEFLRIALSGSAV